MPRIGRGSARRWGTARPWSRQAKNLLPFAARTSSWYRGLANEALAYTRRKGLIGAHLPLQMIGTRTFLTIQGMGIMKASRSVPSRL
jgi:hypothetical protein